MTGTLERAITFTRALSPQRQDEIARLMMLVAGGEIDDSLVELSVGEEAALRIGLEQADRGEFATEEQVRATFSKFGR